jgi:anaerobic dimethyl sulfoxide reductase subunit A
MAHVPDGEWDEAIEELHREAYEKWANMDSIASLDPPTWEDFQNKPVFRYKIERPHFPLQEDMENGRNPFSLTASGKIEFYSDLLAKGSQYLADNEAYAGSGICYGGGNLPPMAMWIHGGKDTFYHEDVIKYPLLMSSPHPYYREHSFQDNNPWLQDCYRHAVWINTADARARNIRDDDMVRVYNDIAEMVIPAHVTNRIVPGTVAIFHGSWYAAAEEKSHLMPEGIDRRGAANLLIHNEDLPQTIIDYFPTKALVQIEKWEAR